MPLLKYPPTVTAQALSKEEQGDWEVTRTTDHSNNINPRKAFIPNEKKSEKVTEISGLGGSLSFDSGIENQIL